MKLWLVAPLPHWRRGDQSGPIHNEGGGMNPQEESWQLKKKGYISEGNPICEVFKAASTLLEQVRHKVSAVTRITEYEPDFRTETQLKWISGDIRGSFHAFAREWEKHAIEARFQFARYAEPDGVLEDYIAHMEMKKIDEMCLHTREDFWNLENTVIQVLVDNEPIMKRLAIRLEGLQRGELEGAHKAARICESTPIITIPETYGEIWYNGESYYVTVTQWKVLRCLAKTYPKGCTKTILLDVSKRAIRCLKEIKDKHPLIGQFIHFPGSNALGGYRLL